MPPRFVASVLTVVALALERFAFAATLTAQPTLLSAGGRDEPAISALTASLAASRGVLPLLFALVAVVVPRPVVALLGALVATLAAGVCVFGPAAQLEHGLWLMIIGTSAFKAAAFSLSAEFISSPRLKVALVLLAFVATNVGMRLGTDLIVLIDPSWYPSLFGYGLAAFVALLAWGVSVHGRAAPAVVNGAQALRGGAVFVLLVPATNAMWLAYDPVVLVPMTTTTDALLSAAQEWGVVGVTLVLAVGFALAPARLLPSLGFNALMLGLALSAALVTSVFFTEQPSLGQRLVLIVIASGAEVLLGSLAYALVIAMSPPRYAPALVTSFALAATSLVSYTREWPHAQLNVLSGGLALAGLLPMVALVYFRQHLFAALEPR